MNTSRYVIGSLVVFVYIFIFEFLFHGMLLTPLYMQAEQLMRPEPEFFGYFHWIVIGELILAFFFCLIFTKGYEGKGIGEGVRFGLLVGIGFGVSSALITYAVHPFPGKLVLAWVIGYPVEMILAGVIIAAIYKPRGV